MVNEWIKTALQLCIDGDDTIEKKFSNLYFEYNHFSYNQKREVLNFLKEQLEVNDLIYVLSKFCHYMSINEFEEELLVQIYDLDANIFYKSMLEHQICCRIKNHYKNKRLLHKKNVKYFGNIMNLNFNYNSIQSRHKKRIVVITDQILSINHAPTKVVLNFLYTMKKKLGYDVLLFVCPCDYSLPMGIWDEPTVMNSIPEYNKREINIQYRGILIDGYQINMSDSNLKEYSMMFSIINFYNPLFVLSMATHNPVIDVLANYTTVVHMPLSLECPVSESDYLLRLGYTTEEQEKIYEECLGENQKQIFITDRIPVIDENISTDVEMLSRASLNLPEDKFLIAIVGNRLDTEIDSKFIDFMRNTIKRISNIAFVIIGNVSKLLKHFDQNLLDNTYFIGYQKNLFEVYKLLDLYINPDRSGGGFSSSIAINAGIPVVCLPNGDVAYNVGKHFVVDTYKEMQEEIYKYVHDQEYYKQKLDYVREQAENNSEEKMVIYVKNIIDRITAELKEKNDSI